MSMCTTFGRCVLFSGPLHFQDLFPAQFCRFPDEMESRHWDVFDVSGHKRKLLMIRASFWVWSWNFSGTIWKTLKEPMASNLREAITQKQNEKVLSILENDPSLLSLPLDDENPTILHLAAQSGNKELIQTLVEGTWLTNNSTTLNVNTQSKQLNDHHLINFRYRWFFSTSCCCKEPTRGDRWSPSQSWSWPQFSSRFPLVCFEY